MITNLGQKLADFTSDKKLAEILTGSAWALAAQFVAAGLGLVTSIIIARLYGAEMVGIVAVIQSFLNFTTMVTVLGMNTSILRLIPEHVAKYSVTSAFNVYRKTQHFVVATTLLAGVLLFCASDFIATSIFAKPHLTFYFALASGFVIFRSLTELNTQALRGLQMIRTFAVMRAMPSAVMLIALSVILFVHGGPYSPVYAQLATWGVTAMVSPWIMVHFIRKQMQPSDSVHPMSLREILSISSPMLMTTSMQFVIGQTGVILLGIFRPDAEVGYYAVAVKFATLAVFVLQAINSIAAPKFSELYNKGAIDELIYVARKSSRLIFWTTAPILLVLLIAGRPILATLFGQEFTAAYPAMALLVVGQFINSLSGSTGYFMNMTGRQKTFRNVMSVAGLLNIVFGLLLIPRFGVAGAAVANMLCIIFWNVCTLLYIKASYGKTIAYFPFLVGQESKLL